MSEVGFSVAAIALVASCYLSPNKFQFHQFYYFSCKLHKRIVTCYILEKKSSNFNKTSGFAFTIVIAACSSIYVYGSSTPSVFFIASLLFLLYLLGLHLYLRLRLRLLYLDCLLYLCCLWLTPSASAICALPALSAFSMACLWFVSRLLYLHLLCLGCLLCSCFPQLVPSPSAICDLSTLSVSSHSHLLSILCPPRLCLL